MNCGASTSSPKVVSECDLGIWNYTLAGFASELLKHFDYLPDTCCADRVPF
jgi:hypothetical protein